MINIRNVRDLIKRNFILSFDSHLSGSKSEQYLVYIEQIFPAQEFSFYQATLSEPKLFNEDTTLTYLTTKNEVKNNILI